MPLDASTSPLLGALCCQRPPGASACASAIYGRPAPSASPCPAPAAQKRVPRLQAVQQQRARPRTRATDLLPTHAGPFASAHLPHFQRRVCITRSRPLARQPGQLTLLTAALQRAGINIHTYKGRVRNAYASTAPAADQGRVRRALLDYCAECMLHSIMGWGYISRSYITCACCMPPRTLVLSRAYPVGLSPDRRYTQIGGTKTQRV